MSFGIAANCSISKIKNVRCVPPAGHSSVVQRVFVHRIFITVSYERGCCASQVSVLRLGGAKLISRGRSPDVG